MQYRQIAGINSMLVLKDVIFFFFGEIWSEIYLCLVWLLIWIKFNFQYRQITKNELQNYNINKSMTLKYKTTKLFNMWRQSWRQIKSYISAKFFIVGLQKWTWLASITLNLKGIFGKTKITLVIWATEKVQFVYELLILLLLVY